MIIQRASFFAIKYRSSKVHVFLTQLLKSKDMFLEETEQQIAISYICGFLGHYVLDTTCHPYIFAKSHYGTYDKGC